MNTPEQQKATWLAIYKLAKQLEDKRDGMSTTEVNDRDLLQLLRQRDELVATLEDVNEFLDGYVDVNDGEDGQPVANKAMSLQIEVQAVLAKAR